MQEQSANTPLFSIGITTYNRPVMLKQLILSFLAQEFADFELLIGNDYIDGPLSCEMLGIDDKRVKIINHPVNLGERENMNALLSMASGRYFSWQFDDDLVSPFLLESVYNTLIGFNYPEAVYTSFEYVYGNSSFSFRRGAAGKTVLYSGRDFLRAFLSGKLRLMGLGGFHDTALLRKAGGAEKLSSARIAVYAEYLLIVREGLLQTVAYNDARLLGYRVHNESYSSSNSQTHIYSEAGLNLLEKSLPVLTSENLKGDFRLNIESLIKSSVNMIMTRSAMGRSPMSAADIGSYLNRIRDILATITDPALRKEADEAFLKAEKNIPFFRIKAWLRAVLPLGMLRYAHILQSWVSGFTNKSF